MTATKEITRYCQIVNVLSFDPQHSSVKQILFTLPADVTHEKMEKVVKRLIKKGFEVPEVEDLHQGY